MRSDSFRPLTNVLLFPLPKVVPSPRAFSKKKTSNNKVEPTLLACQYFCQTQQKWGPVLAAWTWPFFFSFFFSYFEPPVLPFFVLDQPPFLLCVGSALPGEMNANRDVGCGFFFFSIWKHRRSLLQGWYQHQVRSGGWLMWLHLRQDPTVVNLFQLSI